MLICVQNQICKVSQFICTKIKIRTVILLEFEKKKNELEEIYKESNIVCKINKIKLRWADDGSHELV